MARPKVKSDAPSSLKLKTCTRQIREGSQRISCGKQYLGEDRNCPNRDIHILKIKTGFCNLGLCEGTKPVNWRGTPMKTCSAIATCFCTCHDELGKLFELTGQPRVLVEASGYKPAASQYVMPERATDVVLSTYDPVDTRQRVEDAPTGAVPPIVVRSYQPTPSGRTARGQLEQWVLTQCTIWSVEEFDFPCTPVWISKNIAYDEAIPPPSVGAISAVFDRWVKLGFAVIETKPTRFAGFTDEGKRLGLEKMKIEAKRKHHLAQADLRRNTFR